MNCGETQHVSKLLVWCHPSTLKTLWSNLTPRGDTNVDLEKNYSQTSFNLFCKLQLLSNFSVVTLLLELGGFFSFLSAVNVVNNNVGEILNLLPKFFIHFLDGHSFKGNMHKRSWNYIRVYILISVIRLINYTSTYRTKRKLTQLIMSCHEYHK